jgi:hypothetical protein
VDDYALARQHYTESLELFRQFGDKFRIAYALHNLGHVVAHEREPKKAQVLFAESLELFREVGHKQGIAECLTGLAGVAGALGQTRRAAILFGAAEALLGSVGAHLDPADRIEYGRNVAASKAYIDDAGWQAAWEEGRDMSLDQALGEALSIGH